MRRLTGRVNFRRTFWGRIVLQVEEESTSRWSLFRTGPVRHRFRDANVLDLTKVELRPLLDLRNKLRADAQSYGPARPPSAAAGTPAEPTLPLSPRLPRVADGPLGRSPAA
jgi:hypothetical protein